MKNISLPLIIGAVMCVASILFGVNTINSGGTVKGILWMVAALCWASFVRNVFRKNNNQNNILATHITAHIINGKLIFFILLPPVKINLYFLQILQ